MNSPSTSVKGFTLVGLLVVFCIIVVVVLSLMILPRFFVPGEKMSPMFNAKQIHLAVVSMATDGAANKDDHLGWPGDLKAKGYISNLSDFVTLLVRYDYLKPNDLKVFASPEFKPYKGKLNSKGEL